MTTRCILSALVQHSEHNTCIIFSWDWATRTTNRDLWRRDRDLFVHNITEYNRRGSKRTRTWSDLGLDRAGTHRSLRRRLLSVPVAFTTGRSLRRRLR